MSYGFSTTPVHQRGIAAITAMLVVTLATLLAVEMLWELTLNIRRTEVLFLRSQAREIAMGPEIWVADILREDFEESGPNGTDTNQDDWAREIPPLPVEGGTVDGFVQDMQARFNLNNLIDDRGRKDPLAFEQFQRLLVILELEAGLAEKVLDWIDPDQQPELSGAEDDIYTSQTPPYRTANFWFTTTSELLAIDGFNGNILKILDNHVAALPLAASAQISARKINVNTATIPVLQSLGQGLTEADADTLAGGRPYDDIDQFMDMVEDTGMAIDSAMRPYLEVGTNFFRLNVIVSLGTTRLAMYSLLERSGNGIVTTRLRSFDTS